MPCGPRHSNMYGVVQPSAPQTQPGSEHVLPVIHIVAESHVNVTGFVAKSAASMNVHPIHPPITINVINASTFL